MKDFIVQKGADALAQVGILKSVIEKTNLYSHDTCSTVIETELDDGTFQVSYADCSKAIETTHYEIGDTIQATGDTLQTVGKEIASDSFQTLADMPVALENAVGSIYRGIWNIFNNPSSAANLTEVEVPQNATEAAPTDFLYSVSDLISAKIEDLGDDARSWGAYLIEKLGFNPAEPEICQWDDFSCHYNALKTELIACDENGAYGSKCFFGKIYDYINQYDLSGIAYEACEKYLNVDKDTADTALYYGVGATGATAVLLAAYLAYRYKNRSIVSVDTVPTDIEHDDIEHEEIEPENAPRKTAPTIT